MDLSIFDIHFYIFHVDCSSIDPIKIKNDLLDIPVDKKVIVDGGKIICLEQIEAALLRAGQAELNGTMLANDWSIEVLLHLKGQHQIRKSLDFFNVTKDTRNIVLIIQEKIKLDVELTPGLPQNNPENIAKVYAFPSNIDMCKQIISDGARLILDYY